MRFDDINCLSLYYNSTVPCGKNRGGKIKEFVLEEKSCPLAAARFLSIMLYIFYSYIFVLYTGMGTFSCSCCSIAAIPKI